MVRNVKTGELFATFNFDGKDCADMGIYSVTSGAVYTINIEPTFSDENVEVPAYDGKYYYGTKITGQQFQFNCFCHDLLTTEYDRLRAWLNPRRIGRLILSDQPYKYYLVKPVSISTLGAYPLTTIQTPDYSFLGDYLKGDVVYTGNFTVTFETVGSAYGYGLCYYRDDLIYDAKEKYGRDYYYNSGLLYKDMNLKVVWDIEKNAQEQEIPFYNPGNAEGFPTYLIEGDGTFAEQSLIQINNTTAGTSTVIDLSGLQKPVSINMSSQTLVDATGKTFYGRFTGTIMKLTPYRMIEELPETFIETIENTYVMEYDSFYIENNVVMINPKVLEVSEDLIFKYFCVNKNGGSKILDIDKENNALILDPNVYTHDIPRGESDNGIMIRPSGIEYRYVESGGALPEEAADMDVCVVHNKWYLFNGHTGRWEETSLFASKEDFMNIYGYYIPIYKVFGATIVEADYITITTGKSISNEEKNSLADVDTFTLSGSLQPRYL